MRFFSALLLSLCTFASIAGEVGTYPNASAVGGTERMLSDQGGATVDITPNQLVTFINANGTPNVSSATGTLTVGHGGTGAATLTGPLKGNGTSAFTAAASADIYGLWSGSCSVSTFLRGDGACAATGTVTSVGLTAPGIFTVTGSPVTGSGTLALGATGTSGGIPYFSSATGLASSAALTANALVLGGGAGGTPTVVGSLGTTTTVLHGNASGAPTYGAVALGTDVSGTLAAAQFPALTGDCTTTAGALATTCTKTNGTAFGTFATANAATPPAIGGTTPAAGSFTTLSSTGAQSTTNSAPCNYLVQSGAGTNLTTWGACVASGVFSLQTDTDALAAGSNILTATRGTTTAISNVSFGNATNNPTYSFLGTGAVTAGGVIGGSAVVPTAGGTVPSGASITQTAGSSLIFNIGGLTAGTFSSPSKNFAVYGNLQSAGTKFTASGCSNSTTVGGAWAGSYNSGTTGTCTVVITLPTGATNGYTCWASDTTTPANIQTMTASTTSSATISGTTVSGDVIKFGCLAY